MSIQTSCNYTNNNPPHYLKKNGNNLSFQGLNRYLSKHFPQTAEEAVAAANKYRKSRGFVGNLPADWIENIPKKKRKSAAKKIQDLFEKLAKKLYSPADEAFDSEFKKKLIKESRNSNIDINSDFASINDLRKDHYNNVIKTNIKFINKTLLKFKKIVGLDAKITVIPDGFGSYGKVYKLTTSSKDKTAKDYAFKVFHSDELWKSEINLSGKMIEAAREVYAKANSGKLFSKFYFGKVAKNKDKGGFVLTEFLTDKTILPTKEKEGKIYRDQNIVLALRLLKSRVVSIDVLKIMDNTSKFRNLINGKLHDIGHTINISDELAGKMSQDVKKLRNLYFNKQRKNNTKEIEIVLQSMKENIRNYVTDAINRSNNRNDIVVYNIYSKCYEKIIDIAGDLMKLQMENVINEPAKKTLHNRSHNGLLSMKPVFCLLKNN